MKNKRILWKFYLNFVWFFQREFHTKEFMKGRSKLDATSSKNDKLNVQNISKIVQVAMDKDMAPLIVFSFSKADCEQYAIGINKLCFNTGKFVHL